MALVILIAIALFATALTVMMLSARDDIRLFEPAPDNVITIADWSAALQQRRERQQEPDEVWPEEPEQSVPSRPAG